MRRSCFQSSFFSRADLSVLLRSRAEDSIWERSGLHAVSGSELVRGSGDMFPLVWGQWASRQVQLDNEGLGGMGKLKTRY